MKLRMSDIAGERATSDIARERATMNWFAPEPVSTESMIQTGLPLLEAFAALLAIIAILTLVIAVLHTILAVRSTDSRLKSCPFRVQKVRADDFLPMPAARTKRLQAFHLRGW